MKKLDDIVFEAAVITAGSALQALTKVVKTKDIAAEKIDRVKCNLKNRKEFKAGGSYDKAMQQMKNQTPKGDLVDLGEKKI